MRGIFGKLLPFPALASPVLYNAVRSMRNHPFTFRGVGSGFLVASAVFTASPRPAVGQVDRLERLDELIETGMEAWEVPGLALAIVKDDSVVLSRGYGVRELGSERAVDDRTLFAVASCTKAFTAAALGILVANDKLQWDTPVNRFLPQFELYDPWITRHLTIRDMLSHRTGYPGWAADHLWQGSDFDRAEVLYRFRFQRAEGEFRSNYGYSNIMYLAAGEIIPAVTEQSWEAFVTTRLLEPLGMTESVVKAADLEERENVAVPHMVVDGELKSLAHYDPWNVAPAMALNSNAIDMAQWLRLHLAEGVMDGDTILPPDIVAEMHTPQIWWEGPGAIAELEQRDFSAYGLGWDLYDYQGHKVVRHDGSIDGMASLLTMVPSAGLGIVVLTNRAPNQLTEAVVHEILDAYLEVPDRDWNTILLEQRAKQHKAAKEREWRWEETRNTDAKPTLSWGQYLGDYVDELSGTATVTKEQGHLVFRYNSKYIGDLEHYQYDVYRIRWRDPYVTTWAGHFLRFLPNGEGGVGSLRVRFDNEIEFHKR